MHAFVMAERSIEEKDGRFGVIGMFSSITLKDKTQKGPPWLLFMEVSGFAQNQEYDVRIAVEKPEDETPVCEIEGKIRSREVKRHVSGIFSQPIPEANYPSEGLYNVSLSVDGEELASRLLEIKYEE